ncbi:hypothetical protein TNIN_449631 [Trichonephila inaurata madagascariensis]|uniref:Uncharacterized protein n=1 Tax=Trichonephila inaurata madagascariensis TaxID=2747483 RepID=A0A8X6M6G3_9ARAC|nr:hypothetical protein TNIN_449631 [Trichonephila inaurata madagascariensis]
MQIQSGMWPGPRSIGSKDYNTTERNVDSTLSQNLSWLAGLNASRQRVEPLCHQICRSACTLNHQDQKSLARFEVRISGEQLSGVLSRRSQDAGSVARNCDAVAHGQGRSPS